MLKKCLKHEWKACWKNMALLNGAAIFMGALGGSGFLFSQISELPDLLIVLYLFAYVLIVIAASVMTQVLMIQRYYKNLFTDEGYLTNVLPVSATDHILSKMLVFGAWSILNALSVLASFAFLLLPSAIRYFTANTLLFYNKAMTFSDFLSYLWAQITGVADAAFSLIGITNHIGMALFSIVGFFASLVLWHSSVLCRHQHRKPGIQPQNSDGCPLLHRHDYRDPDLRRNQHRPCFPGLHTDCCGYHILGFHTYHHRGALRCSVPDLPLYLKQTAESFIKIALKSAAADEPNRLRRRFVCMFCTYARCQISSLYCAMVRSEEKKPAFAMLIRHFLFHASLFS